MRTKLFKIGAMLLIFLGLGLAMYPWISEFRYENQVDTIIYEYEEEVAATDNAELEKMMEDAREYNRSLLRSNVTLTDPFTAEVTSNSGLDYYSILNLSDRGIMAFIEIPKIDVYLPIYHGTSADVLESGIGHLENTSMPVGGESTHSVISGHTGLNSAKLFTDLTALEENDLFFIHIMSETLAYRVCDINVVEPHETSLLGIQDGRDLITMVTCTPYGINSHRLLVTGERTEYTEEVEEEMIAQSSEASESQWMTEYRRAIIMGVGLVLTAAIVLIVVSKVRAHNRIIRSPKDRRKKQ